MIIGISGKIGSGKDLTGKIIQYLTTKEAGIHSLKGQKPISISFEDYCNGYRNPFVINGDWKVKKFAYKLKEIVALLTGCKVEDLESQDFKNKVLGEEWNYVLDENTKPVNILKYSEDELFKANPERFTKHYSYRTLLQFVGTNAMRDIIHENIWVNALFADYKDITLQDKIDYFKAKGINDFNFLKKSDIELYKQLKEDFFKITRPLTSNWIITDTRFPNELKAIKDRSGISIRVNRHNPQDGSEYGWGNPNANHPSETSLDSAEFDYVIDNSGSIEDLIEKVKQILIKEKII